MLNRTYSIIFIKSSPTGAENTRLKYRAVVNE